MENESKNVTLENEIFTTCEDDEEHAIDRNGFVWNKIDEVDKTKPDKPEFSHYYIPVDVEKNEQDECYELYYKVEKTYGSKYAKDREGKLLGKIDFNWLSNEEEEQIDKLIKIKSNHAIRLTAASVGCSVNKCAVAMAYHHETVKYKYLLFLFIAGVTPLNHSSEFDVNRSRVLEHTPLLDRLYLRMFFPEVYEREIKIDEKISKMNNSIKQNFYSKRKKILWRESLSYAILLALSVVAMLFSLINLMIFIIAAAILTVIFGFGLLYEFKFREIPYIDELPQEEIDEIKKQIEQEKNQNKNQDQNKDDKENENQNDQEKNKNVIEINTEVNPKNKESLTEKTDNMSKNRAGNNNEENKSTSVFSLINENKNDNKGNKTNPTKE